MRSIASLFGTERELLWDVWMMWPGALSLIGCQREVSSKERFTHPNTQNSGSTTQCYQQVETKKKITNFSISLDQSQSLMSRWRWCDWGPGPVLVGQFENIESQFAEWVEFPEVCECKSQFGNNVGQEYRAHEACVGCLITSYNNKLYNWNLDRKK